MNWNWLWKAIAASVVLLGGATAAGCNDAGQPLGIEDQIKVAREAVVTLRNLGVQGDVMLDLGPGYVGLFNGLLIDSGLRMQIHVELDPPGKNNAAGRGVPPSSDGE